MGDVPSFRSWNEEEEVLWQEELARSTAEFYRAVVEGRVAVAESHSERRRLAVLRAESKELIAISRALCKASRAVRRAPGDG